MSIYKLRNILLEGSGKSKAIVMAGGAGSGKSTFINNFKQDLESNNWEQLNADKYVEDKDSEMYNNLGKASSRITKHDLPNALKDKKNFIYDTTGSNINLISSIKNNKNYDTILVMLYTHPIVSFIRNFKRERKVPTVGVLSSWNNVYKNIEEYKKIFGNSMYLTQTGVSSEEKKLVDEFNSAHKNNTLPEFFEKLLSSGSYRSTFRKDPTQKSSPEQIEKSKQALSKQVDILSKTYSDVVDKINKYSQKDSSSMISAIKKFINNGN